MMCHAFARISSHLCLALLQINVLLIFPIHLPNLSPRALCNNRSAIPPCMQSIFLFAHQLRAHLNDRIARTYAAPEGISIFIITGWSIPPTPLNTSINTINQPVWVFVVSSLRILNRQLFYNPLLFEAGRQWCLVDSQRWLGDEGGWASRPCWLKKMGRSAIGLFLTIFFPAHWPSFFYGFWIFKFELQFL